MGGGCGGGGGAHKGLAHNLLLQLFTRGSSKTEVSETISFDMLATQNDHPSYVKRVLGSMYASPYLGIGWGGVSQGIGMPPAHVVFQHWPLKNRSFRNLFVDIVTSQNGHATYVKHVGNIYVFCLIWIMGVGRGVWQGIGTQPVYAAPSRAAQKSKFPKPIFLIFWPLKMIIQAM